MESSRNLLPKGKKSSRILKMSYIKSKKLLTITFNSGATYEYYDVPTEVIDGISFYAMRTTAVPEDVSLKEEYEYCKDLPENDFLHGKYCVDVRKQYQEKFGKEQAEQ